MVWTSSFCRVTVPIVNPMSFYIPYSHVFTVHQEVRNIVCRQLCVLGRSRLLNFVCVASGQRTSTVACEDRSATEVTSHYQHQNSM